MVCLIVLPLSGASKATQCGAVIKILRASHGVSYVHLIADANFDTVIVLTCKIHVILDRVITALDCIFKHLKITRTISCKFAYINRYKANKNKGVHIFDDILDINLSDIGSPVCRSAACMYWQQQQSTCNDWKYCAREIMYSPHSTVIGKPVAIYAINTK